MYNCRGMQWSENEREREHSQKRAEAPYMINPEPKVFLNSCWQLRLNVFGFPW